MRACSFLGPINGCIYERSPMTKTRPAPVVNEPAALPSASIIDLFAAAQALKIAGDRDGEVELYQNWLAAYPQHPLLHAGLFNQAVVLNERGDLHGAKAALAEAIRREPSFIPPYINLGTILERMGAVRAAMSQWTHVVERLSAIEPSALEHKLTALKQIGRMLEIANADDRAEYALRQSLELDPHQPDVIQHWISLRQRQCKWPVVVPFGRVTRERLLGAIAPLASAVYTDDPWYQLGNAVRYCREDVGRPATFRRASDLAKHDRSAVGKRPLRIGYVSSDLREHAIGFLMSEMFNLHDRARVEIFAYYCGVPSTDPTHERFKQEADHWRDFTGMSDAEAAALVEADQIDILVDVNGYTKDARTKVFAMRPAPINVNWLGYPGTMGSPYHHYMIADPFIVPPENERYFTEKVVRLPCYQPSDRNRKVMPPPTRAEMGLPEDAVVFCCFNGAQKITSFNFDRWLEILKGVPNSVLWLLQGNGEGDTRLRQIAEANGIDPARILFADKRANAWHMARYPLADLFLDTLPYGAHTTCSDALWMGVPVLTLPGRGFAARVCGSLVTAAGFPDCVCDTPERYVSAAIRLGNDRRALAALKERVKANRDTCTLFDMPKLVRSMEDLFEGMWEDFRADKLPRPNLTNLDQYLEIAVTLEHETEEFSFLPDYDERYRARLIELNDYAPLPADGRLLL